VFATQAEPSIVVERAVTRTVDDTVATSVIHGATPREGDGHVAATWHLAAGPPIPTTEALIVYNATNSPGLVSVFAVGSSGPVPVADLQELELGPAAIISIDLTDPVTIGRELFVSSTTRVFVERSFPTGRGETRTSSWAVPAG
jgi:hypothetical protein